MNLNMVGVTLATLAILYFFWSIERSLNYNFGYDEMVKKTIVEMVKPTCLK